MLVDTTRLLLMYNVSDIHWVLVEIEVDAAETSGHVRRYNSMGGTTADKRGIAYATVKKELPGILQLIQRRPDLGWQHVQFSGEIPGVRTCPQQDNSTDCGFWSIFLAEQLSEEGQGVREVRATQVCTMTSGSVQGIQAPTLLHSMVRNEPGDPFSMGCA